MRSAAEIDELSLPVKTQGWKLLQLAVDVLDFVALTDVLTKCSRLAGGPFEALERLGIFHDPAHFLFDLGKILFLDGRGHVNVVIEAVVGGRAEGELNSRKQTHDRPRHDMGAAMTYDVERFAVFFGENLEGNFGTVGRKTGR